MIFSMDGNFTERAPFTRGYLEKDVLSGPGGFEYATLATEGATR
jgi:hypothetical protein